VRSELFNDHYSQARQFYRSQLPIEQAHLASALVFELSKVTIEAVRTRVLSRLRNVDEELASRVADGLAMPLPPKAEAARAPIDLPVSDALSIVKNAVPTLKGRKVGILFDEGSDLAAIEAMKQRVVQAGGTAVLIAPKVGGIPVKGGTLKADGQLAGTPSVLVDAVAIIVTAKAAAKLAMDGAAVDFVHDAFGHLKAIGHDAGAQALLDKAGVEPDAGVTALDDTFIKAACKRHFDREPKVRMMA
jgi:catalase